MPGSGCSGGGSGAEEGTLLAYSSLMVFIFISIVITATHHSITPQIGTEQATVSVSTGAIAPFLASSDSCMARSSRSASISFT